MDILVGYIARIKKKNYDDYSIDRKFTDYIFYGDGRGDFEEHAQDATLNIVKDYIVHCEEQIEFAKEYLKLKEK